jgi:uncharacterized damage-inducible protein DinB
MMRLARCAVFPLFTVLVAAQTQPPPPTSKAIRGYFEYVNGKVLDMAKDFPEDKYDYRPTKEMRSFGELIVHIASGNVFAAKVGRGEQAKWDELDPKNYKTKADVVGLLQKSIDDSTAALKAEPDEQFSKTLRPWLAVMQHSSEHYGLLVAYFRLNGMVPPETRKEQNK